MRGIDKVWEEPPCIRHTLNTDTKDGIACGHTMKEGEGMIMAVKGVGVVNDGLMVAIPWWWWAIIRCGGVVSKTILLNGLAQC